MFEWVVQAEDSGLKLINFLTKQLSSSYSARFLKKAIEQNRCQINEKTERFASTIIGKGNVIRLDLTNFSISSQTHEFDAKRILYEDESLLIYNKPAGINCDEKGILAILKSYQPTLQLIHRLDRDTTGLLLVAKTPSIFYQMVEQFKALQVHKRYLAIVDGLLLKEKGAIENYLGKKHDYAGQTVWGVTTADRGLYAYTGWLKIESNKQATLLYCFPKTGRTHQIRVHLASIGHPLLGDFQYGKQFMCSYRPNRYLLHADAISFHHPKTGQPLQVQAPKPQDFKEAQQALFKKA